MKTTFIFLVAALFVFSGCQSKPEPMKFTGITQTDNFGTIQGTPDTTDWRSDDVWTSREMALFKDSIDNECRPKNFRIVFFPNPCRKKSTLFAFKDSTVRLAIRLVDKDMNIIMSKDNVSKTGLEFNLSSFKTDDTLRLYYKFIVGDSCEYKGHGDIFVNPYK